MDVLTIQGPEQSLLNPASPDGGLPPAVGVHSFQIFRASSDVPAETDTLGYTYHHHVDIACWKGRLYVGWNACQRDEDVWPSRELYSSSLDGSTWTSPAELFPQGMSVCLRMYFYHAANGTMLAITGLRTDNNDTDEDRKFALIVRQIRADHTLGEVFALQASDATPLPVTRYESSTDAAFKEACRLLLADTIYLEQQDRGRLLADRRMKWHDASAWPGGQLPGDNSKWVVGKAFSFFQRRDGLWVGVSKMGWVTTSTDNGKTWTQPAVPSTLITGKAKVWSQRTADGNVALVYNPSRSSRYPLVVVTSQDDVNFRDMRIVQGELPIQRYAGLQRSIGPQYTRGISHWANDGSRDDVAIWLVYSMSKEDIWVSRVPLPVQPDQTTPVADDFADLAPGPFVAGWNIYRPKWSSVEVIDNALRLENRDPYDYPIATRVFPESSKITARFDLECSANGYLEIDLLSKFGSHRLIQLKIGNGGIVPATTRSYFQINADATRGDFSLSINGTVAIPTKSLHEAGGPFHRITFRLGPHRGIGGSHPVPRGTDRPVTAASCRIFNLAVSWVEEL
jgi:hypothetical protein